jgi:hypothetical protein
VLISYKPAHEHIGLIVEARLLSPRGAYLVPWELHDRADDVEQDLGQAIKMLDSRASKQTRAIQRLRPRKIDPTGSRFAKLQIVNLPDGAASQIAKMKVIIRADNGRRIVAWCEPISAID